MKFLLILILFHPSQERFKPIVSSFNSMEECQIAQIETRKRILPEDQILFVLKCHLAIPTNGVQI